MRKFIIFTFLAFAMLTSCKTQLQKELEKLETNLNKRLDKLEAKLDEVPKQTSSIVADSIHNMVSANMNAKKIKTHNYFYR